MTGAGRRHALVTLIVAASALGVVSASTSATAMDSSRIHASVATNFPVTVEVTLPAGGDATVGSPSLPAKSRKLAMKVELPPGYSQDDLADLATNLATLSNQDKLLTCASIGYGGMYTAGVANISGRPDLAFATLQDIRSPMRACFQIVAALTAKRVRAPSGRVMRSTACTQVAISVPVAATGSGDAAIISVTGAPLAAARPTVRISCRIAGNSLVVKVNPRSRKATLRQVFGDRLSLGFTSSPAATGDAPIRVTYGKPR